MKKFLTILAFVALTSCGVETTVLPPIIESISSDTLDTLVTPTVEVTMTDESSKTE